MKQLLHDIWKLLESISEFRAKNHHHHGWW
jgi:hypothetical protein